MGAVVYLVATLSRRVSLMWIVKGVLLGILLFVVGGISYVGIRIAIAVHRLAEQVRAGTARHGGGAQYDIRGYLVLLHSPVFLGLLLAALAIGLWIMRPRPIHPFL